MAIITYFQLTPIPNQPGIHLAHLSHTCGPHQMPSTHPRARYRHHGRVPNGRARRTTTHHHHHQPHRPQTTCSTAQQAAQQHDSRRPVPQSKHTLKNSSSSWHIHRSWDRFGIYINIYIYYIPGIYIYTALSRRENTFTVLSGSEDIGVPSLPVVKK